LFIVVDVFGRSVELSLERYLHIASAHPEIEGKQDALQEILQKPDFVKESKNDPHTRLFYKKINNNEYHLIIVKYEVEDAFILTSYFSEYIKGGKILWKN